MMEIPTIVTPNLTLRPFNEGDVDALHGILGQEGVLRYFPKPEPPPWDRVAKLIADQLQHWEDHGLGWWAVEPRSTQELIGWNGLQYLPETKETEVGFLLSKAYWGQGLATEAAQASLQYGFERLGLETIVAIVHPQNIASQRVIEKLGMSFTNEAHYFGMAVYRYQIDSSSFKKRTAPPPSASL